MPRLSKRSTRTLLLDRTFARELIAELAALSKAEKAEVLERLAQQIGDAWPGVDKTTGVADLVHAWA